MSGARPGAPAAAPRSVPVSVVIAAKNEGAHIGECVESVRWAAEVLVVEDGSADDTAAAAARVGATVLHHPFSSIANQRNVAIARTAHDWILVVDADERGTPALGAEIAALLAAGPAADAFRVPRRNYFLGREIRHGGWERDRPVRLFRRALRYDERLVHEHVVTQAPPGRVSEAMLHYSYTSMEQYFAKLDLYSRWWARQNYDRGRRASALAVVGHAPARFLTMYLLRGGFLDGAHGLVLAVCAAMSVAAKYARLWALGRGVRA